MTTNGQPAPEELAFFDTNGYLVLEDFLDPDHVARLTERLEQAATRRDRGGLACRRGSVPLMYRLQLV